MSARTFHLLNTTILAVAAAVRIANALTFPSLRGYDGFGHFVYVWFVAETGRVPLATSGWSFFHPPLYYAVVASIWNGLPSFDPLTRLRIAGVLLGVLSLAHALVSYAIVRRLFPHDRLVQLLAPGLMLFLPVLIYTAPFLGNEGLNAILCSFAFLLLIQTLQTESISRGAALGVVLGLAMLTKMTSLALVAGALASIAVKYYVAGRLRDGARTIAVVGVLMLAVCGWYYGRNVAVYGTPFRLSRDQFMVRHIENYQTRGRRTLLEYLTFDPMVFRRPVWPRGIPLTGELPPDTVRSAVRESVWTGVYANAWFDGFGGTVIPPVTTSERVRRAGQILLTLAIVPTLLIVAGFVTAIGRLRRNGWDDVLGPSLLCLLAMIALFVQGTRAIPMHAAVKASYLMPVSVTFSVFFALGLDRFSRARPRWRAPIAVVCAAIAVASTLTFWHGLVIPKLDSEEDDVWGPAWKNAYGIVRFAGGDRAGAQRLFEAAAKADIHLGWENLAALALDEGRPLEALFLLRNAARLQPLQSFGLAADRAAYDRATRGEYSNTEAVIYYELGWLDAASKAVAKAVRDAPILPEANFDSGVIDLTLALGADDPLRSAALIKAAERRFAWAAVLDPGFAEAQVMAGVAQAMGGDCAAARETIRRATAAAGRTSRVYPEATGPGLAYAAAIKRRRHIVNLPPELHADERLRACVETPRA